MKKTARLCGSLLVALLLLTGCTGKKGAENYVKDYYQQWIDGNMSAEKTYDEYTAQLSKELFAIDRDTFVQNVKDSMEKYGLKHTSVKISSSTKIDDNLYKIKRDLKVSAGGQEINESGYDYVIKEGDEYKLLQYGAYEKEDTGQIKDEAGKLNVYVSTIYTGIDDLILTIKVDNRTKYKYGVGWAGIGEVVVETDKGTYNETLTGTAVIPAGETHTGEQVIKNAKGKVKKITVNGIFMLSTSGRPVDQNKSESIQAYLRENTAQ